MENMGGIIDIGFYEDYIQKGGSAVIPTEIYRNLLNTHEYLLRENAQLIDEQLKQSEWLLKVTKENEILKQQLKDKDEKIYKAIGHINACCGEGGMSKDEIRCLKEILEEENN